MVNNGGQKNYTQTIWDAEEKRIKKRTTFAFVGMTLEGRNEAVIRFMNLGAHPSPLGHGLVMVARSSFLVETELSSALCWR